MKGSDISLHFSLEPLSRGQTTSFVLLWHQRLSHAVLLHHTNHLLAQFASTGREPGRWNYLLWCEQWLTHTNHPTSLLLLSAGLCKPTIIIQSMSEPSQSCDVFCESILIPALFFSEQLSSPACSWSPIYRCCLVSSVSRWLSKTEKEDRYLCCCGLSSSSRHIWPAGRSGWQQTPPAWSTATSRGATSCLQETQLL